MYEWWGDRPSKWDAVKLAGKRRKEEGFIKEKNMNDNETFKALADILEKSARKAREVMTRDCVVAERAIRVGEFVTVLRRELQTNSLKHLADSLTCKSVWHDILVINKHPGWRVDNDKKMINMAVAEARRRLDSVTSNKIEQDIADMETLHHDNSGLLAQSNGLVEKSEELMIGLEKFADKVLKQNETNHAYI